MLNQTLYLTFVNILSPFTLVPRVDNSGEGEYPTLIRPVLNKRVEQSGYYHTFPYFLNVLMQEYLTGWIWYFFIDSFTSHTCGMCLEMSIRYVTTWEVMRIGVSMKIAWSLALSVETSQWMPAVMWRKKHFWGSWTVGKI